MGLFSDRTYLIHAQRYRDLAREIGLDAIEMHRRGLATASGPKAKEAARCARIALELERGRLPEL